MSSNDEWPPVPASCCWCGTTDLGAYGQLIGACLDLEGCRRRRAVRGADNVRELPPCTCLDFGDGCAFTLSCPRHDPFFGLLATRHRNDPADFTGLLGILNGNP